MMSELKRDTPYRQRKLDQ